MGVDYSASFGLGFEFDPSELYHLLIEDFLHEGETEEDLEDIDDTEIIEALSLPEGMEVSYWGNSYTNRHTFFVRASSHATTKEELVEQWDMLENFIADNKLEDKTIGIIGGGLLW